MNTDTKLSLMKADVIHHFREGLSLDEVCAKLVAPCIKHGIPFGEILTLVKHIATQEGFIIPLADRKDNCKTDIAREAIQPLSYKDMNTIAKTYAKDYDVPVKWSLACLKEELKANGYPIPRKPQLTGWKLSALECWKDNDIHPDVADVRRWIREDGHNMSHYTEAYHELFVELVALGHKQGYDNAFIDIGE